MNTLGLTISFIFGTLIGSFLNVVILRLPEGQSLLGRSHCPNCKRTLGFMDLVPLLSYLVLRGRCRQCQNKISPRYFFIELATALLFMICWLFVKPESVLGLILLLKFWFTCSILVAVFMIDLEHYLILDSIVFLGIAVALAFDLAQDIIGLQPVLSFHSHLVLGIVGAIFASLPFFLIWAVSKGRWMGFGDVKLALFLGATLMSPIVFVGLMLAVLSGGLVSVVLLLTRSKTLKSQVPSGTFLSFGAVLAMFYGEMLLKWYLAILGF